MSLKAKVIAVAKKNPWFREFCRGAVHIAGTAGYFFLKIFHPVDKKLVVFASFQGRSYACSPRRIYEVLRDGEQYRDYRFIWAFDKPERHAELAREPRTQVVRYGSLSYYRAYARAGYWVSNSRLPEHIFPKRSQVYLQTWHGTPLKRLGYDIEAAGGNAMNSIAEIRKKYDQDSWRYTYLLSPSRFCSEKLTSAFHLKKFGKENCIVEKGYPRNDFLFRFTPEDVARIRRELGLPEGKKVVLYAPTFRDNRHTAGLGYTYDLGLDFDRLREELGEECVILFRAHYLVANSFDFSRYKGFVFDVSGYDNINDLYVVSDLLMTDYSSVFFDYANLKRPMVFYMYDLAEYQHEIRDFYLNLEELPGEIVTEEKRLAGAVREALSGSCYNEKYQAFHDKFNYLDGPDCGERVAEYCFK